jgi:hypothetical protein
MNGIEDIEWQKGKLIMMQILNFNPTVTESYLYLVLYDTSDRFVCAL